MVLPFVMPNNNKIYAHRDANVVVIQFKAPFFIGLLKKLGSWYCK
jgi:hypothetical protein